MRHSHPSLLGPFVLVASTVCAACAQGGDDNALNDYVVDSGAIAEGGVHDAGHVLDAARRADAAPDQAAPPVTGDDGSDSGNPLVGDDSGPVDDAGVDAHDAGTVTPPDSGPVGQKPAQGEILITEVMFDPSTTEPDTEWFEVHNTASSARDLGGLTLSDGSGHSEVVAGSVTVAAGAYVVLANKSIASVVPAAAIVYKYSSLTLANGTTGGLTVKDGATIIGQSPFGGFASAIKTTGASIQLKTLSFTDETLTASWCKSANTWSGSTDKGTPGAASDCP